MHIALPTPVKFFQNEVVEDISCGESHTLAMLSGDRFYAWGLGRAISPTLINTLKESGSTQSLSNVTETPVKEEYNKDSHQRFIDVISYLPKQLREINSLQPFLLLNDHQGNSLIQQVEDVCVSYQTIVQTPQSSQYSANMNQCFNEKDKLNVDSITKIISNHTIREESEQDDQFSSVKPIADQAKDFLNRATGIEPTHILNRQSAKQQHHFKSVLDHVQNRSLNRKSISPEVASEKEHFYDLDDQIESSRVMEEDGGHHRYHHQGISNVKGSTLTMRNMINLKTGYCRNKSIQLQQLNSTTPLDFNNYSMIQPSSTHLGFVGPGTKQKYRETLLSPSISSQMNNSVFGHYQSIGPSSLTVQHKQLTCKNDIFNRLEDFTNARISDQQQSKNITVNQEQRPRLGSSNANYHNLNIDLSSPEIPNRQKSRSRYQYQKLSTQTKEGQIQSYIRYPNKNQLNGKTSAQQIKMNNSQERRPESALLNNHTSSSKHFSSLSNYDLNFNLLLLAPSSSNLNHSISTGIIGYLNSKSPQSRLSSKEVILSDAPHTRMNSPQIHQPITMVAKKPSKIQEPLLSTLADGKSRQVRVGHIQPGSMILNAETQIKHSPRSSANSNHTAPNNYGAAKKSTTSRSIISKKCIPSTNTATVTRNIHPIQNKNSLTQNTGCQLSQKMSLGVINNQHSIESNPDFHQRYPNLASLSNRAAETAISTVQQYKTPMNQSSQANSASDLLKYQSSKANMRSTLGTLISPNRLASIKQNAQKYSPQKEIKSGQIPSNLKQISNKIQQALNF